MIGFSKGLFGLLRCVYCISTAFVHDGDNINDALKIKEKTIVYGDVN